MKILITGAKGQLGNKLIEKLADDYELVLTDSDTMDITDASVTEKRILEEKPDFIIHGAAYTKVEKAEEEQDLCRKINVDGTKNVAEATRKSGATLIYISTDFVFSGKKAAPYRETDQPDPPNFYAKTKFEGEQLVEKICDKYYILRTAWLYGDLPSDHPNSNFVEKMLKLAKDKEELGVVDDQVGSPTYTGDLVSTIKSIIEKPIPFGLYHFSGEGETTWYNYAKKIFELAKVLPNNSDGYALKNLKPITSAEYPFVAKYPTYSYLSKEKIKAAGVTVRPWEEMLKEYLDYRK